jgi:hypothetical protein
MIKKAGVIHEGKLLEVPPFENVIEAGRWIHSQGYDPNVYRAVLLLENGDVNHRAIIQVYDCKTGRYTLENHYTTCGTFHLPMEKYEADKEFYENKFMDSMRYLITCWIDY